MPISPYPPGPATAPLLLRTGNNMTLTFLPQAQTVIMYCSVSVIQTQTKIHLARL